MLIISIYYTAENFINHLEELSAIKTFLQDNRLTKKQKLSKVMAEKVSEAVRKCFNTDDKSWKYLSNKDEPFLRYSVLELLKYKEGKCGKGARVIVKLLQHLGFDATRISLFGRDLSSNSSHTLVSILISGKEYFIDSINSSEEFNCFVKEHDVNTRIFGLKSFNSRKNTSSQHLYGENNFISSHFIIYSYGIPFSQILYKFGIELEVFNFSRPPKFISNLAESVYLAKFIFFLFITIICLISFGLKWRQSLKENGIERTVQYIPGKFKNLNLGVRKQ